jgi:hypothetical protein
VKYQVNQIRPMRRWPRRGCSWSGPSGGALAQGREEAQKAQHETGDGEEEQDFEHLPGVAHRRPLVDIDLGSGRNLLPEMVRNWRARIHAAEVAIGLQLGSLDS